MTRSDSWGRWELGTMESCEFWLAAMVSLPVHGQMSLLDAFYIEVIFRAKPARTMTALLKDSSKADPI
jgi:hypothetical protein